MNTFQYIGDCVHLSAIILLLFKILRSKSSAGISGNAQILLALVFTARYTDIYVYFSLYHFAFKATFLAATYITVILIHIVFSKTYERNRDVFRFIFLIPSPLISAVFFNYDVTFLEISWAFSIYLECVAMWPQFYMNFKSRSLETTVFFYLLLMGTYRIFYVMNWIYRFVVHNHQDPISFIPGIAQIFPYLVFWYMCTTRKIRITNKESSWFLQNLNEGQNSIFVITVPDKSEETNEKSAVDIVPLLKDIGTP